MAKKKAYLVMPRTTAALEGGLKTAKGTLKFKKGKTHMMVGDEGLANEINTEHGLKGTGDVWVAEDQRGESFLRDDGPQGVGIHRYFWGASPAFSNAWDAFEKRRKDKNGTNRNRRTAANKRPNHRLHGGNGSTGNSNTNA